ncbi:MAG TPA: OprD family outer membrane porin [Steroidobacteraceae bacterium]|nr:OprD family outer membrane porin [Steroidobacteraceae bacterium]
MKEQLTSPLQWPVALRAIGVVLAVMAMPAVRADTLAGFLSQGSLSGELRSYYFRRDYGAAKVENADAFAVAGLFNYQTPEFLDGFSVDAGYFTANALGTHNANPARIDTTLSGVANSINALGEAYLQYRGHGALVRLGAQRVTTPWASSSDSRVLPATYEAAYGAITPVRGLKLEALRILRYKSRTADGYFRDDNYYPPTWHGDAAYGGLGDLPASAPATAGTVAAGADYEAGGLEATTWYYDFYDFGHLVYAQVDDTLSTERAVEPFAGLQVVREWGGSNVFERTGTRLLGQPGMAVSNFAVGGVLGIKFGDASLSAAYDRLRPEGVAALGGGALISPYTESFATDPLYTTSMIRGMVELGPGSSWKLTASETALQKRLELTASFAEYHTYYNGNDSETYFDVIYELRGRLKGLSLRNRLEIGNGRVNPGRSHFLYNRVMLAYAF